MRRLGRWLHRDDSGSLGSSYRWDREKENEVSSREAREESRGVAKLIYSMNPSLDGFISGPDGNFDWSMPDEELHRFHNERTRALGGHLLGRRLY